jgi:hypothetical protein
MADGPILQTPDAGTAESPPSIEGFEDTPELGHFKNVMRRILAVPKSQLDRKVRQAKKRSPRAGNPNAPGRKKRIHG